jgi:hypothetical protein
MIFPTAGHQYPLDTADSHMTFSVTALFRVPAKDCSRRLGESENVLDFVPKIKISTQLRVEN